MSRCHRAILVLLVGFVCVHAGVVADATARQGNGTDVAARSQPRIVAAYPNAVVDGEASEFVVVDPPGGGLHGEYTLTDGERTVPVPSVTGDDPFALTTMPRLVGNLTRYRVVGVNRSLSLANGGETITLQRNGTAVSTVRYRDAPEGKLALWREDALGLRWRPLGATDRPVVRGRNATVTAFALPDADGVVPRVLRSADRRVWLAGYTLTSRRVVDALVAAHRRGVDVRVLLEGGPVGGIARREARLLDELAAAGVDVRLLSGPRTRYAYHHAKYAVVDDRALVLTENFKPAGTGGRSSRGWGAVVDQRRVVAGLAATYRADAGWAAARPWHVARRGRTFTDAGSATGRYPSRYDSRTIHASRVELLVTPDNARPRLVDLLDHAEESIRVIQMSIDERDDPLLQATLRAARRGVHVRILLSSAWFAREENGRLVEWLNERADAEDLPLEAKLADPGGRYEKIHAKGVVVDNRHVVLGSLNWNRESMTDNREVVVVLSGDQVAGYYGSVFDADWRGGRPGRSLPVGLVAAAGGCLVLAVLVGRRYEFSGD
ncbi:MAG: phospholipase D-like domain-containing protein [Haloarculaceae archaeon]